MFVNSIYLRHDFAPSGESRIFRRCPVKISLAFADCGISQQGSHDYEPQCLSDMLSAAVKRDET